MSQTANSVAEAPLQSLLLPTIYLQTMVVFARHSIHH